LTKDLVQKCAENGLVIISAGTYGNVIRILSPLVIEAKVLNKGLDILENALKELC
jgi:4-aminobutyrate aminotransferase/(S)-3-amino-2-methylpropionate transaminase